VPNAVARASESRCPYRCPCSGEFGGAAHRPEQLTAPAPVTAAFAATTRAAVGIIVGLNRQSTDREAELATHFEAHPDADIYLSLLVTSIAASVATSFAALACYEFRTGLRLREAIRADLPSLTESPAASAASAPRY